jgi:hypothetical protein
MMSVRGETAHSVQVTATRWWKEQCSGVHWKSREQKGRQDNKQLLKITDPKQDKPYITLDNVHCLRLFDVEELPVPRSISLCVWLTFTNLFYLMVTGDGSDRIRALTGLHGNHQTTWASSHNMCPKWRTDTDVRASLGLTTRWQRNNHSSRRKVSN